MHCVQACLQMLLYSFEKPVLSLQELDEITHHEAGTYTWMSDALLWLEKQGFEVENYENLDYRIFAAKGKEYLRQIWGAKTFELQDAFSNLDREQAMASKLLESGIRTVNARMSLEEIKQKMDQGFFVMLSVNPHALKGDRGYGSHMVVVQSIAKTRTILLDPDATEPSEVSNEELKNAISEENKQDFNAIFVRVTSI